MDKVRNEEVRRRAGIERELASRADQRVLRWIGHMERMDEAVWRPHPPTLVGKPSGGRVQGRPRLGWMDGVKVALGNRGMIVEDVRKIGKSGDPWYIFNNEFHVANFPRPCVLSDRPPMLWWLSPGEGGINCEMGATTENQVYELRGVC